MRRNLIACFREISTFAGYSDAEIGAVLELSARRNAAHGEVLFSQGEPCKAGFVLITGAVKLTRHTQDNRDRVIGLVVPESSFAEAALVSGGGYLATAVVQEPSELVVIPSDRFKRYLAEHPKLAWSMMSELSHQVGDVIDQFERLVSWTTAQKVAAYLLGSGEESPFPQADIANLLCIRRETLSRTIREFRQRDWVRVEHGHVVVIDPCSLRRVVRQCDPSRPG